MLLDPNAMQAEFIDIWRYRCYVGNRVAGETNGMGSTDCAGGFNVGQLRRIRVAWAGTA